jgi:hypothetical protein
MGNGRIRSKIDQYIASGDNIGAQISKLFKRRQVREPSFNERA